MSRSSSQQLRGEPPPPEVHHHHQSPAVLAQLRKALDLLHAHGFTAAEGALLREVAQRYPTDDAAASASPLASGSSADLAAGGAFDLRPAVLGSPLKPVDSVESAEK